MIFPNELRKFQSDFSTALKRGQIASPSLLYTNHDQLNDLTRNAKGRYTTYSMVDKKLDDATNELNKAIREIEQELKDNKNRVKRLSSMANGVKHEVEIRSLIGTLLNNKIAAIKAKVDIAVKADNARKGDIKLAMDLGGAGPVVSSTVGDTNSFISSIINTGVANEDNLYNITKPNINSIPLPSVNTITPIKPSSPNTLLEKPEIIRDLDEPIKNEEAETKESTPELNLESTPDEIEEAVDAINEVHSPENYSTTITNALGEVVELLNGDDVVNDYIEDTSVDQSLARAEKYINASSNPDVEIFFKYYEPTDSGHLIAINKETLEELPDVTTLPLDLLYPWSINKVSGVVSTMIREEYPILFTDEPIDPKIEEELKLIKKRFEIE